MFSYVTIGTNDLEGSAKFYDDVLAVLGGKRAFETDNFISWSDGAGGGMLSLNKPYDGNPATVGNGVMIALTASSPELVDAVHKKALECGGADEGVPGPRGTPGNYYGYFRDLDGNKICAACLGGAG
jgi:catechol 2,3-dioxygenase-like lactoylglutathione lyase family enzyme